MYPLVNNLMVGRGQDIKVNERLQSFLEANEQVQDIVRKDLIFPYGKSSGRVGEIVSGIFIIVVRVGIVIPDVSNDEICYIRPLKIIPLRLVA